VQVLRPTTLDEALDLLADAAGRSGSVSLGGGAAAPAATGGSLAPIAGGTDLLVSWHHQPNEGRRFLDLSRLQAQLQPWRLTDDTLELGALTTYWDVITAPPVAGAFPLLAEAARQVGAIQIQMRGTWAGNVGNGSPAADGVLVLMAYDARVVLRSQAGQREIPLDQFYTGYRQTVRQPNELIVGLRLPRRPRIREWFHKVGARQAQAISKVAVAVVQDAAVQNGATQSAARAGVQGASAWRVVANSVAPVVKRCTHLEAAFAAGRTFATPADVAVVLSADIAPIDDIRSTAHYRATVLSRLLYFWLQEASGDTPLPE
jgi:CO/xanthine dehydrogenase FAD-binding subunit